MNGRLRVALGFVLCSLLTGSAFDSAAAQAKPNFSGKWTLVPDSGAAVQQAYQRYGRCSRLPYRGRTHTNLSA